jgi:hypothetical protein
MFDGDGIAIIRDPKNKNIGLACCMTNSNTMKGDLCRQLAMQNKFALLYRMALSSYVTQKA